MTTDTREKPITLQEVEAWFGDAADFALNRPLSEFMADGVRRNVARLLEALEARTNEVACYEESNLVMPGPDDIARLTAIATDPAAQALYFTNGGIFVRHEHVTWEGLLENGGVLPEKALGVSWQIGEDVFGECCQTHLPILLRSRNQAFYDAHVLYETMLAPGAAINCAPCRGPGTDAV